MTLIFFEVETVFKNFVTHDTQFKIELPILLYFQIPDPAYRGSFRGDSSSYGS